MIHPPSSQPHHRPHPLDRLALGLAVFVLGGVLLGLVALAATPSAVGEAANAQPAGGVSLKSQSSPSIEAKAPTSAEVSTAIQTPFAGTPTKPATSASVPAALILDPPPGLGPFSMDLYHKGQFVSELLKVMCVPAAIQTMINMMSGASDRSTVTQDRLYALARKLSPKTLKVPAQSPKAGPQR